MESRDVSVTRAPRGTFSRTIWTGAKYASRRPMLSRLDRRENFVARVKGIIGGKLCGSSVSVPPIREFSVRDPAAYREVQG